MRRELTLLVAASCVLLLPASADATFNPVRWAVRALTGGREPAHVLRQIVLDLLGRPADPQRSLRISLAEDRVQQPWPTDEPFPCDVSAAGRSPGLSPSSVHALRPADVRVVAAMGDSLTAGNGGLSTDLLTVFGENRGVVWSIGGQGTWRQFLTLPNLLREFSPGLVGAALGDGLSHTREAQFNVADSFAMTSDMPHMARVLVRRIQADPRVNFTQDWKLVTLMVGANDLCHQMCSEKDEPVWERHERNLIKTLDYLQSHLPRTLVSLVMVPDPTVYTRTRGVPLLCSLVNYLECPCMLSPSQQQPEAIFKEAVRRMQQAEERIASSGRYDVKDDFTVVLQPFSRNVTFPLLSEDGSGGEGVTDLTYLSHDCFHFSQKGYAWAANALWNNLLEPVGRKSEAWEAPFTRVLCPGPERPFFFTARNSNVSQTAS